MYYFTLLLSPETDGPVDPEAQAAEMTAYQNFHAVAASAIRGGDALLPTAVGAKVTGGPNAPHVTDGPFVESAEVALGYYVFEAENLDVALELARQIPAAKLGGVEVWPMAYWNAPTEPVGNDWIALLLEPQENVHAPDSPEFERCAQAHAEFKKAAGDHLLAGAPLHPPTTATTVRVRDGKTMFTDGPYVESAEVASGFYLLRAADRDEAVKLASMIPATGVEVRQLAGVSAR